MERTQTENAQYYFDPAIEKEERAGCIAATEEVLKTLSPWETVPEIYVFAEGTPGDSFVSGNRLYLSVQDWDTVTYAADVLLCACGEGTHYGLAYGYAAYLKGDKVEGQFSIPVVEEALDLNLLCFDPAFVSDSDIRVLEQVALDFVDTYIQQYGEQGLVQALFSSHTAQDMEALCQELHLYYLNNGVQYEPSRVRYGYGSPSFAYMVYDDDAIFCVEPEWEDLNREANPLLTEGFLHTNYAETRAFFETTLKQMEQYRTLFDLEAYREDLSIVFSKDNSLSQYSFYQSEAHRIYVKNVDSLMHEYIHALTQPQKSMESWQTEGFARYFSYRYDAYGIAFLNEDYNNTPNSAATRYVHEYLEKIGRPIDMAVDYAEVENIAVYSRSYRDPNAGYVAGSSFVQYLVAQYGEQAVIQSIYGDKAPLPEPYAELVHGWNAYIEDTYQSYSKYR